MPRDSESAREGHIKGEENIDPAGAELALGTTTTTATATAISPSPHSLPSLVNLHTASTLHPPPAHIPKILLIERYLHLTALTPTTFTNTYAFWQVATARGIPGGEIIAQCIMAAAATVAETFWLHSVYSFFVLAGDARIPITYEVTNVRTGKIFATRDVTALQRGQPIVVLIASYYRPTPLAAKNRALPEWEAAMPEVPKPWEFPSEQDKIKQADAALYSLCNTIAQKKIADPGDPSIAADEAARSSVHAALCRRRLHLECDLFEWRALEPRDSPSHSPTEAYSMRKVRYWVRMRESLSSSSRHVQNAVLAYLTDSWFIGTVARINPAAASEKDIAMIVSLDHEVYFHPELDMRVEGWLLVEMDAPWVAHERGVVTQRIWRASDGRLIATCEGPVRLEDGTGREDGGEVKVGSQSSKL